MNYQTKPTTGRHSYFPFEPLHTTAQSRLEHLVMQRIADRRLAQARGAAALYGVTTILGGGLLVAAVSYTASLAQESGFMSYVSLIASDGADLVSSWKPFLLSLLESAPVVGSALVLTALLVCGYSLMKLVSDITRIRSHRHAIL